MFVGSPQQSQVSVSSWSTGILRAGGQAGDVADVELGAGLISIHRLLVEAMSLPSGGGIENRYSL